MQLQVLHADFMKYYLFIYNYIFKLNILYNIKYKFNIFKNTRISITRPRVYREVLMYLLQWSMEL